MDFERSVFINCPFDNSYDSMLHTMIFTIVSLGYKPRLALESSDASVIRLETIMKLICQSRISIHDLSRIKPESDGEFSRMNMPFEFGLDFGCKKYTNEEGLKNKKFLVLGGKRYDYMKALSDISGIDIQYHNNEQTKLVSSIRHWFVINEHQVKAPSPNEVWMRLMDFNYEYELYTFKKGYSKSEIYEIPINERIDAMNLFISKNPYD